MLVEKRKESTDAPPPIEGRYGGGAAEVVRGKEAGPALNPLKGILGFSSPDATYAGTSLAILIVFIFKGIR
jgi:hypothetical protein